MENSVAFVDAIKFLPSGDKIHTMRQKGDLMVSEYQDREKIIALIKKCGCFLSGDVAIAFYHGLVIEDQKNQDLLFIETTTEIANYAG